MAIPLSRQIHSVGDCLSVARRAGLKDEVAREVEAAMRTLSWVAEHREQFREFYALEQSPAVQAVKDAFPGARVSSVRRSR